MGIRIDNYGVESPCQNCKHRDINCHSFCQEYAVYKSKLEERKSIEKAKEFVESQCLGMEHEAKVIMRKKITRGKCNI